MDIDLETAFSLYNEGTSGILYSYNFNRNIGTCFYFYSEGFTNLESE